MAAHHCPPPPGERRLHFRTGLNAAGRHTKSLLPRQAARAAETVQQVFARLAADR